MIVLDRAPPRARAIGEVVRRNAYGRQVASFEADRRACRARSEPVRGCSSGRRGIEEAGPGVEVLAEHDGERCGGAAGDLMVAAFHPELSGEPGASTSGSSSW